MPVFEFRCLNCGKIFEKLFRDPKEEVAIECPDCHAQSFERVISKTNYLMGTGKGKKPKLTTKSCSPGSSCSTLEVPGAGD
ncbi:MAG: zinc ribbon domain-containing protein [Bacillota bacterium]